MLNYAAAPVRNESDPKASGVARIALFPLGALLCASLMLTASSASALPGIDLSQPAEPTAAGECPQLIQIKYPFLDCANGQIGLSPANETWENSRQIPHMSDWTEGDGAFGPDRSLIE